MGEVVKVFVGEQQMEFIVNRELICQASRFFSNVLTGPFKEGHESTIYIPEDEPYTFSLFVDFLYQNPLPFIEAEDLHAQLNKLLSLYYFAEKYFINQLMDQTMDRLRE